MESSAVNAVCSHIRLDNGVSPCFVVIFYQKKMRTASPDAATHSKHKAEQTQHGVGLRSRTHVKATPDGLFKCMECGFISNTLQEADAHHFRTHERQPAQTFMHTAP
jgi:hypothetical protein